MSTLFVLYCKINVAITFSYFVFRLLEMILGAKRSLLRSAQLVLLASVFAPLVFELLPETSVSSLPQVVKTSGFEEGWVSKALKPVLIGTPSPVFRTVKNTQARSQFSIREFLLILVTLIALARVAFLWRERLRLSRLLKAAIVIKRIGKVSIVISSQLGVPFSARASGRAWVTLPAAILGNWKDAKIAIFHELQHHRQGDAHWAMLVELLVALFFLNPFMSFWKRLISEFQEFSCDEALIGRKVSPYEYGSCLVRVAEAALGNGYQLVGIASMAAGAGNPVYFKSFLRTRVEMLSLYKQRAKSFRGMVIGAFTLCVTISASYASKVITTSGPDEIYPGVITTDPEIQKIAEQAILAALKRHKATMGFVVVADPNTGRILAVANRESKEGNVHLSPHWALGTRLGAASLAKPLVAAQAVEKRKTTFSEVFNCEKGNYTVDGRVYRDWKDFRKLTTSDMVVHSSNVCGIKVGERLGALGVENAFRNFGIGSGGTAEGFPESRIGQVPKAKSDGDRSYIADHASGVGGLYVTPIEVVQAFGAIANGGKLLKPQTNDVEREPQIIRRVLSESTANETKQVLAEVMVTGTAKEAASKWYRLAGKTATGYSEIGMKIKGKDLIPNLAAFAGFAPVENPKVVIFVAVENPSDEKDGKAHGAYHAAPVFREVAEKTLQYWKVPMAN